ncbi:MAG: TonB-dependent receptor [Rhodocyclales bacterium]|nr:TonB-dependent receptor [Rhodocyclales bacterium]
MSPWLKRGTAGVALALAAATAAAADLLDMPLESLLQYEVEGASRFVQPLTEAPSAVAVVSAEDIRRYGYRNLGEALQSLRGVYVTDQRDYSYIGIRGFSRPGDYNARMLLLADGVRRNDPLYDTAQIGHDAPLDMDWIKQLEFAPGPASALYGANAIFGVANAVLWSGADLDGSRVTAELGSGDAARLSWLAGRRGAEGGGWVLGIAAYRRGGADIYYPEFDAPGVGDGWARGRDGERTLKGFAKLDRGNWRFDASFSARRKNVPTADYGTLFDTPGNFYHDQYAYAGISHSQTLAPDWTGKLHLRAGRYDFAGEYVYAGLLNRDETLATWWGLDYLLTYTGRKNHKLLIGAEAQRNVHLDQRNFDVEPAAGHFADARSGNAVSLFVQDEWRIDRRWMTNLGLRADRVAGGRALSPRAALIFHPLPEVALKLMHGRACRPPNSYERYYNDGNVVQKANPDLQPERIATDELTADYALSPRLRLAGSYYHYRMDNLIEQVTDPADGLAVFVNRPTLHAHGVELEAESLLGDGLRIRGSLARQRVQQDFGTAVNSPQWMGKLHVDGPLGQTGWTLAFAWRSLGAREGAAARVPGQAVANLVATRMRRGEAGAWSVGLYNLSGKRHLDPAAGSLTQLALPQDGRQLRATWSLAY